MQGEEHLVFSEYALTGSVKDRRFTPRQAQIWTYTFIIIIGLKEVSYDMSQQDYLFVTHNESFLISVVKSD